MHLLVSDSIVVIARFYAPLAEKGPLTVLDSVTALWPCLPVDGQALVVLDLALPGLDATAVLAGIRRRAPHCKMLVLKNNFSTSAELALLGTGVAGCCSAMLMHETIVRIIDMVLDGGVWISHAVMPLLLRQLPTHGAVSAPVPASPSPPALEATPDHLGILTPRERQIARLVGHGASNKLIARELSITDRTVKAHLGAIFQKLGLPDRLQLALYVTQRWQ